MNYFFDSTNDDGVRLAFFGARNIPLFYRDFPDIEQATAFLAELFDGAHAYNEVQGTFKLVVLGINKKSLFDYERFSNTLKTYYTDQYDERLARIFNVSHT